MRADHRAGIHNHGVKTALTSIKNDRLADRFGAMVFTLLVERERLIFGQRLIEGLSLERVMGAGVHQPQSTRKTRVDDIPGPLDVDDVHHRVFFWAEVDLRSEVIHDIHAVRRPGNLPGIEYRARHELDVEAGQGLR